jgi:WD40 repeat protein
MASLKQYQSSWNTLRMSNRLHGIQVKRYVCLYTIRPLRSEESQLLASASYDDTIKLYIEDPSDDWFCFATLTGHTSTVWSLAWSPVGSYLASSSDDKTVRIWRRVAEHKWESVLILSGHERSIYSISWGRGASGRKDKEWLGWLATVGGDGKILVWELEVCFPTSHAEIF